MRSDKMWSLPISPVAAIIYESIHSGALNGSVDSDGAVMSPARPGRGVARAPRVARGTREPSPPVSLVRYADLSNHAHIFIK